MAKQTAKKRADGSWLISCLLGVLAIAFGVIWWGQHMQIADLQTQLSQRPVSSFVSSKGVTARLLAASQTKTNPLTIAGLIPGNWGNEGVFPVVLKNSSGTVISQGSAQIHGDWMTSELRPFSIVLQFNPNQTGQATLELKKDNPSGLPGGNDTISIPITL